MSLSSCSDQRGISLSQLWGLNKIPTLTPSSLLLPPCTVFLCGGLEEQATAGEGLRAPLLPGSLLEEGPLKFQKKPVLWELQGLASSPTSATKKAL